MVDQVPEVYPFGGVYLGREFAAVHQFAAVNGRFRVDFIANAGKCGIKISFCSNFDFFIPINPNNIPQRNPAPVQLSLNFYPPKTRHLTVLWAYDIF